MSGARPARRFPRLACTLSATMEAHRRSAVNLPRRRCRPRGRAGAWAV